MSSKSLHFLLFGEDVTASKAFKKVAVEAEASSTRIAGAYKKSTILGAGGLVLGLAMATKEAANFETGMVRLVTAAGESEGNLKGVSKGVLKIAADTGTSTDQMAKGMYIIESAGYHGAAGLNVLKSAAQGAKIEGADLGEVANALSSLLVDYHLPASEAAKVTSQLVAAVGRGKTTFQELATALPNVAAAAASLNVTLPETTAAIATMTMHGTDAAKAGTYLRQMLGQLGGGGSAVARKTMQGLGIDANKLAMTLSSGSGHGLADAITMLEQGITSHLTPAGLVAIETFKKSTGSASDYAAMLANLPPAMTTTFGALAKMTGGVKSMQGFLQLGGENLKTFQANTLAVARATGDADGSVEGWARKQQTLNQKMDQLKQSAHVAVIEIGNELIPSMTKGADFALKHKDAIMILVGSLIGLKVALIGYKLAAETVLAVQGIAAAATKLYGKIAGTTAVEVTAASATEAAAVEASSAAQVTSLSAARLAGLSRGAAAEAQAVIVAEAAAAEAAAVEASAAAQIAANRGAQLSGAATAASLAARGGLIGTVVLTGLGVTKLVKDARSRDARTMAKFEADIRAATGPQFMTDDAGLGIPKGGPAPQAQQEAAPRVGGIGNKANLDYTRAGAERATAALGRLGSATAGVTAATEGAAEAAKIATGTYTGEKAAVLDLAAGLKHLNTGSLDVKESQLSFLDSLQSLTDGVKQNGRALGDNTAKGRANQEAVLGSIRAAQAHAVAMTQAGTSAKDAAKHYMADEDALRKSATAAGLSTTAVDALIKKYGAVPADIQTAIRVEDAQATAKVAAHAAALAKLPTFIRTKIEAGVIGFSAAEFLLDNLARDRTAKIRIATVGGSSYQQGSQGKQAFASGTTYAPGGWADVGEQGRERVFLPRGSRVASASQTRAMSSGGGDTIVNVYVTQPLGTPDQIAKAVIPAIAIAVRNGTKKPW